MVKRVLADFHHTGLYNSLHLLFEKRLGMELYRPIGVDWFAEGFWRVAEPYNNDWQTVNQYLSVHQAEIPKHMRLNKVELVENGVYEIGWQRAIELQTFKKMKFDYIIGSIPSHYREFTRLRNLYQPQAKVICQVGNQFDFPWEWASNIMSSTKYTNIPTDKHVIFYHQEFPLEIFNYTPLPKQQSVCSFLHHFGRRKDYPLWLEMKRLMPDWEFRQYGSEGIEPYLADDTALAQAMLASKLIVQFKEEGDGFGHIIHNIFAMGRVCITKKEYYQNRMAFDLMVDGATCFFWRDDQSVQWNIDRILSFNLETIGRNAYNRFIEVVNYDKEADEINHWLEKTRF